MKRSSTAQGPVQFKGPRTPTKDIIKSVERLAKDLKDKKRKASEALHQMDVEQMSRLMFHLRWLAQNGDKEAARFVR
jgi:hypothetical protein